MITSNPTILVIGAAGQTGGLVAAELARRGTIVRTLLRSPMAESAARASGATDILIGDLRDPASVARAVRGVQGVFHIGPAFVPDEAHLGVSLVEQAKRADVRKFVFSSVIHPTNGALSNHASKLPVEEALFKSGMEYTILYPATFFHNLAAAWPTVVATGVFAEPFSATASLARVDYRDVAEVAAEAFSSDRLAYGSFELCADEMLNRIDIAKIMSEVLERPVAAIAPDFETWAEQTQPPYDGRQMVLLKEVFDWYSEYGSRGNSLTLNAILGRPPRNLRDYIAGLAMGADTAA
jgi:uncharacterized protein YbjT (DUF2867 family)